MQIRKETTKDWDTVFRLNVTAFETDEEANLVNALRKQASPIISLVAEEHGNIVGHILFSPVTLVNKPEVKIIGLAPMAVDPQRQNQGIGSKLVVAGLEACKNLGFVAAVVLGHANYYPRFGFVPASQFGIGCEYDVPDEVFMAMELEKGSLQGCSGKIQYHAAFNN